MTQKPLVIHQDRTLYLLEWLDPGGRVGQQLTDFADLIKAPEEIHTFELSPYAIWSAAAKGITADHIISTLEKYLCNQIPENLKIAIKMNIVEFGMLKIIRRDQILELQAIDSEIIDKILKQKKIATMVINQPNNTILCFRISDRINLKKVRFC